MKYDDPTAKLVLSRNVREIKPDLGALTKLAGWELSREMSPLIKIIGVILFCDICVVCGRLRCMCCP